MTELYETLCTSYPHTLVEVQSTYSSLFNATAMVDLRLISEAMPQSAAASNVGPLLVALLQGAPHAVQFSNAGQVEGDVSNLRSTLSQPAAASLPGLLDVFGRRTRSHLRDVAVSYARLVGEELKVGLGKNFGGDLLRALLLLLEPAEDYFARKLHAGFYGLKKTPEMDRQQLLGSSAGKVWDRIQVSRGYMTHDDTIVSVVATRFGRDLSAIAAAYQRIYGKTLARTINEATRFDMCRLLVAIVEGAVMLAPAAASAAGPSSSYIS